MRRRRRFIPSADGLEARIPLDATGLPCDAETGVYPDPATDPDDPGTPPDDPTDPVEPDPSPFDGDNPPTVPLPPAPIGPAGPAY